MRSPRTALRPALLLGFALASSGFARAQLTDVTQTPNAINAGIRRSLTEEIGTGRGSDLTPDSSLFLVRRDPFRAIQRGRQLFQRKFTRAQGNGPRAGDGIGDPHANPAVSAGLSDSCAGCHSRPFGSAGSGGNVFTRPDSRDAPHLFGLGLKEMIADEITAELRTTRAAAIAQAAQTGADVTLSLVGKGVHYGSITAHADGSLDTSGVQGVNVDLRVRPFFAQGKTVSIREFVVGALKAEMGQEAFDSDLLTASSGGSVTTPAGMHFDGTLDTFEAPPVTSATQDGDGDGVVDEVPQSLVDYLEFYLLNYFKPGLGKSTTHSENGRALFVSAGCADCHIPDFLIRHDRRVADVATVYDPAHSNAFSRLFATAEARFQTSDDGSGLPLLKLPALHSFRVRNIFTDFKRHDLGAAFHEREFDGSVTTMLMTTPLWGVGSTGPYGHDGRSPSLEDVIMRHGGEAQAQHDAFAQLSDADKADFLEFLGTLVLFSPPDTASNLAPPDLNNPQYPLFGHGSIDLSVLFNVPSQKE